MNQSESLQQQFKTWGLILGLWTLLVLAFAGQLVFSGNLEWRDALLVSLRDWVPWVLLAPAILWLSNRFPLERRGLSLGIPVHLAACILAVAACELFTGPAPNRPGYPPQGFPRPFREGQRQPPDRPPFFRPPEDPEGPPDRPMRNPQPERPPLFRARVNLPIYWAIVSIAHAFRFSRRSQERERRALELEARLSDARLEALRMQLHPHFLFNTLNAISTLVHKDPNAADEMIGNLSELLRVTLDTGEQEITLRRELVFLERYLEIQQVRFGQRLRIEKEIEATTLDALVPTLILQPLVENAMRHGIEPSETAGLLRIRAARSGALLTLLVQDDGSGGSRPRSEGGSGIGLRNTQARLQTLYGSEARLLLTSNPESGFKAELQLPFNTVEVPEPSGAAA